MKKEIILLIGNIGTGKSTLAKELAKDGYVIVSKDALRYMIGGGRYIFDKHIEPIIWDIEIAMIEELMENNFPIVVDSRCINSIMRYYYISAAKRNNYKVNAIIMPRVSKEEAVNRRMKNPHGQLDKELWNSVYDKFDKVFEGPTKREKFDEVTELTSYNKIEEE